MRGSRIFFPGGGGGSEGKLCLPGGSETYLRYLYYRVCKFNKFSFTRNPDPIPSSRSADERFRHKIIYENDVTMHLREMVLGRTAEGNCSQPAYEVEHVFVDDLQHI